MAKYRVSKKALRDLSHIWNYTYDTWSENQANKYYAELQEGFSEITDNPEIGIKFIKVDPQFYCYRKNRHIIFYRFSVKSKIEIVRILHEMMDISNQMKE